MNPDITSASNDFGAAYLAGQSALQIKEIDQTPLAIFTQSKEVRDLSEFLESPNRLKQHRTFTTAMSFINYVNRFKFPASSLYATDTQIVCEFLHRHKDGDAEELVWNDHTAKLVLTVSEELSEWMGKAKRSFTQEEFAEFLEARALDVVSPEAASVLEIVKDLHVTRNHAVTSSIRSGGSHSIKFAHDQAVKGQGGDVDIPARLEIRVKPFEGFSEAIDIAVLLRVRVTADHPVFVFELQKLKERLAEVRKDIIGNLSTETGLPAYL